MRLPLCLLFPLLAVAASGCQTVQSPSANAVAATASFDPAEAAFIKKTGKGKIAGHAFWRNGEGGTVNAAGEIIRLVPATAYARERFGALYGGKRTVGAYSIPKTDTDPLYAEYTRTTRAESSGRFEFDNLAPGTYFVTAQIVYKDKSQFMHFKYGAFNSYQKVGSEGGAMFETVTVTGKEAGPIKLVLTNDR